MGSSQALPDERLARRFVVEAFGVEPNEVRRFPTGLMHFVYDVTFADRAPVVVRIAGSHGQAAMRGAAELSRLLRPRGVPLPAILAEKLDLPFPYLILERFPGSDLGEVIGDLSREQLEAMAAAVVDAQRATAGVRHARDRFGYGISSEAAPYGQWSRVLSAHLERSRRRLAAGGRFAPGDLAVLSPLLQECERDLGKIAATPFLHDTTTKNVLVSPDGRLSGIVDVDDLCFGDPRYVVALTQASLLARGISVHYTKTWLRLAGFLEDRVFKLYVALFLADFMAERGQGFNGNAPEADPESDRKLRGLYLETLAEL